jgi:subtilisin-like proprotein convertase family protein
MMKKYFALVVVFLGCLYSLQAQSFFNTNDVLIPDNAPPVYSDITVGGLPAVIDTNFGVAYVCLDITHTYDADLTVSLIAPDGTKVMLFSNVGGGDDNFVNTCLDGFSAGIGTGSAPFTGIFKSMGTLRNVNNGQNPNGVWRLELQDTYGQDEGTLLNWSLTFNNQPAMPFVFTSSNLPLVKISTNGQSIPDDPKLSHICKLLTMDQVN